MSLLNSTLKWASGMPVESIDAYTAGERVARYDRDMAIMHPNREAMIQAVVDVLPVDESAKFDLLDLGIGTGILSQALLKSFPSAQVIGVDGAAPMLEVARKRLAGFDGRFELVAGDFRKLDAVLPESFSPFAVVSSFALHHVPPSDKIKVLRSIVERLAPGGWLVIADIVVAEDEAIESRWQSMRVDGIVDRARTQDDDRFSSAVTTRRFLDKMEAAEGDCPQTLESEIETMRSAGLHHVGVFWQNTREAVYGGFKAD